MVVSHRFFRLALTAPLWLTLAACGSNGGSDPAGSETASSTSAGAAGEAFDAAAGSDSGRAGAASPGSAGSDPGGASAGAAGSVVGAGGAAGNAGSTASAGNAGSAASAGSAGSATSAGAGGLAEDDWYLDATVSHRDLLPVPAASAVLQAMPIVEQLEIYDPGSLLRCDVQDDPAYREVVDSIGGVTWGYAVSLLEDESKPRFYAGFQDLTYMYPTVGDASAEGNVPVEIEESDIVGLSPTSALFYAPEHGLLMVDLSGETPTFDCATKLPGRVDKFFFYEGHLVVMTRQISGAYPHSYLLHFDVSAGTLEFVESLDLGAVRILDTRRFNERLVVYTDMTIEQPADPNDPATAPVVYEPRGLHRTLRVFTFGPTLTEEMTDTLLDTSPPANYLTDGALDPQTPVGTLVSSSSNFGAMMWASDHYFVVTEQLADTTLTSWETRTYSVCTESHTVEIPYQYCRTLYEERPNPDYTEPDNSGGDRACNGTTLADCLVAVSRASNPTIQVPVGRECEERVRSRWICDARESRSYTYPNLTTSHSSRLYIYEYTADGFVRVDSQVSEITTAGLEQQSSDSVVPTLTTSTETYDLAVPGRLQTLYFQNGMLYAIADGVLQVYAMGGPSLVRTASLDVVDARLQTSLFTSDKLYLSDFSYSSGAHDQSVLRVIDLSNPAFPRQASVDRTLPGGHRTILPVDQGILTIGTVANFAPGITQVLKLGLFTDPFAAELAYLILGTDLEYSYLGEDRSEAFDRAAQRLFLPYHGRAMTSGEYVSRVGVSHLEESTIVSEGAVALPELPRRVRPRPGTADEVLTFANSSIEWLRPETGEWSATPVLEYFKPIALYRLSDADDYVEVLRLGQQCKLHFADADAINATRDTSTSDAFDCGRGYPWAFANNIIFSETIAFSFTEEGETTPLSEDEIAVLYEQRVERPVCLFSQEVVMNVSVEDYDNPPPLDEIICYTPDEYQAALAEVQGGSMSGVGTAVDPVP